MNKYTKLSDFEINKKVAGELGLNFKDGVIVKNGEWFYFDPCNNPDDSMPIIIDNGIALVPFIISKPVAYDSSKGLMLGATAENDNVLRAAMEVFLMMKDKESE